MRHRFFILPMVTALVAVSLLAVAPSAEANHTWNGYHWARTRNPFTLKVGDNVSNTWDQYLNIAISDWSKSGPSAAVDSSTILRLQRVDGRSTSKRCAATTGQIEVCADRYGFNGWLGIAQIWISGGSHITQGTVKLN